LSLSQALARMLLHRYSLARSVGVTTTSEVAKN